MISAIAGGASFPPYGWVVDLADKTKLPVSRCRSRRCSTSSGGADPGHAPGKGLTLEAPHFKPKTPAERHAQAACKPGTNQPRVCARDVQRLPALALNSSAPGPPPRAAPVAGVWPRQPISSMLP
jgi:hypothetical protein